MERATVNRSSVAAAQVLEQATLLIDDQSSVPQGDFGAIHADPAAWITPDQIIAGRQELAPQFLTRNMDAEFGMPGDEPVDGARRHRGR